MKNKLLRRTIAIIMTLGMLLGSVSGHVTPVFATGEEGDTIVTEASQEETQAPTEPEAPIVVETEETTTAAPPAEEPTPEVTTEAVEEPTAPETEETTTAAPETEEPTTAAPTEPTTAAPTEPTTAPEETKEKTVKELIWDGGTVKITVSRKDGAEIPESSSLKVETLNSMNQSKSEEEELSIIKSFYEPAIDKIADEYGLDKASEAYKALVAGLLPFALSIKDKDGKETVPEMNVKIEVKDSSNELYDLVNIKQTREIRVAEFDAYKNATLLRGDKASVGFDTAKGTYTAAAKTSNAAKYVVILYIDNDKVKEAQPKAAEQKDDSEEETDGEDADPDSEQPAEEETAAPEEETPEETPAEEEEVVIKSDRLLGGRMFLMDGGPLRDGEGGEDVDSLTQRIREWADKLFVPGGENYQPQIALSVTGGPFDGVYAGDNTISYHFRVDWYDVPNWTGGGWTQTTQVFDKYKTNTVEITLPAGLKFVTPYNAFNDSQVTVVVNADGSRKYTFDLGEHDGSQHYFDWDLTVQVLNNGTEYAIKDYDMLNNVTFNTSFTVLNKRDPEHPIDVYTYPQSVTKTMNHVHTTSPDRWGVKKTFDDVNSKVSADGKTATVVWLVEVGLLDNEDKIITSISDYASNGRDKLEYAKLTDTFSAVFQDNNKNPVTQTTLTPTGDVKIERLDNNTPGTVTGSGTITSGTVKDLTGNLAINMSDDVKVDSDGDGTADTQVPYYTRYKITVTYTDTSANGDWTSMFYELKNQIDTENTAALEVKLYEKTKQESSMYADGTVYLRQHEPAKVNISKELKHANGNTLPYSESDKTTFGDIDFYISCDPEKTFSIYTYDAATETYSTSTALTGTRIKVPMNTDYYLVADGTKYKAEESLSTEQTGKMTPLTNSFRNLEYTSAENGEWYPYFLNRETIGNIRVKKYEDGNPNALISGAKFMLYKNSACTEPATDVNGIAYTEQPTSNGYVTFSNVPFGTYYIKETEPASDYAPVGDLIKEVTVNDSSLNLLNNTTVQVEFTNKLTNTTIKLLKYVGDGVSDAKTAPDTYGGTYVLQRKVKGADDSTYADVTKDADDADIPTTTTAGAISVKVPAFVPSGTDAGKAYVYRFKETIPSGYYDPANGNEGTTYTEAVELTDANGNAKEKQVKLYNQKKITVKVTKKFWDVKAGTGTPAYIEFEENTTKTAQLALSGSNTSLDNLIGAWKSASSSSPAEWTGLKLYSYSEENGETKKTLYIFEQSIDGYKLKNGTEKVISGTTYYYVTASITSEENGVAALTIDNTQKKIPVIFYKKDYYNGEFISGSKFTVKKGDTIVVNDEEIESSAGEVVFLDPATAYTYYESTVPTGTTTEDSISSGSFTTPGAVDYGTTTAQVPTYTIKNRRYPLVKVTKKDSKTGTTLTSGYNFDVYEYDETTSKYVRTIDTRPSVNAPVSFDDYNDTARIPAGTYWFRETTVPTGYVDPNQHPELYGTEGRDYVKVTIGTEENVVLWKVVITNATSGTDNNVTITRNNIPNKGNLKVRKYVDNSPSSGFNITVTPWPAGMAADTNNTGTDGYETFTDLPVYNADGTKITYTISESLYPQQESQYYKVSADQTVQLIVGQTVTKDGAPNTAGTDNSGNELRVDNRTKVNIKANKIEFQKWDSAYSDISVIGMPMAGVTVAIYQKQTDGTWKKIGTTVTGTSGEVNFTGLERNHDYRLVEISAADPKYYPVVKTTVTNPDGTTTTTWTEKQFPTDAQAAAESLTEADMANLNYLEVKKETLEALNTDLTANAGTMFNTNHWLQIHVTKWADNERNHHHTNLDWPEPGTELGDDETELDGSIFKLYRHKVAAGDTMPMAFPGADDFWEEVGTYTTGTLYEEGERQIGQFITIPDQGVESNYVYMMVEVHQGPTPGVVINNDFKYTFWHAEGTEYTASVEGFNVRDKSYTIDKVNYDNIINDTLGGPGKDDVLLAALRIAKWKDTFNEDGKRNLTYEPLPNVSFKLVLASDESKVISNLTVGKDAAFNNGAAWAQSSTLLLSISNGVYNLYDYEIDPENPIAENLNVIKEVTQVAGHDIVIYKIATKLYELTETLPHGYATVSNGYDMYLCFVDRDGKLYSEAYNEAYAAAIAAGKTEAEAADAARAAAAAYGNTTWMFNDAYFVTNGGYDTTTTLAENQVGTSWLIHCAEDYNEFPDNFALGDEQSPLRIVNYPIENTIVCVRKYGYTPTEDTKNMTSDELDKETLIGRTRLTDVVMVLQRYNRTTEQWEYWNYNTNIRPAAGETPTTEAEATFTTDATASFLFPKGLPHDGIVNGSVQPALYRIYEKSMSETDAATYELAYPDGEHARYFTVGTTSLDISMYNPVKLSVKVAKTDFQGNVINGWSFTLKKKNASNRWETITNGTKTTANGLPVEYNYLESGYYQLSEGTPLTGYSRDYFSKYLKVAQLTVGEETKIVDLSNFGNNTGLQFGYTYVAPTVDVNAETVNADVVISNVFPAYAWIGAGTVNLTIKNPRTGGFTIKKTGEKATDGTKSPLAGAKFSVYRWSFDGVSGNTAVVPYTTTNTNNNWKQVYTGTGARETNANGIATIPNSQMPGVYAVVETTAPDGYDIIKTTTGEDVIYYVVIKGGMPVTVSGLPSSVQVNVPGSDEPESVITLFTIDGTAAGQTIEVPAENREKVKITAKKNVVHGDVSMPSWKVTLNLYSDEGCTNLVGTVVLENSTDFTNPVYFKVPNTDGTPSDADVQLSQGATYYMKEVVTKPTPTQYFAISEVLIGGTKVNLGAGGSYAFTINSADSFEITVTNQYLWGYINFSKRDDKVTSKWLAGAEFVLEYYDDETSSWVQHPSETDANHLVKPMTTLTGAYEATFPLMNGGDLTRYRIRETKAPDDYVFIEDTCLYFDMSLLTTDDNGNVIPNNRREWARQDITDPDKYIVNTEGANIILTKWNNTHDTPDTDRQHADNLDAEFSLYVQNEDGTYSFVKKEWIHGIGSETGMINWTVPSGKTYAVIESGHAEKYIGIDSVYADGATSPVTLTTIDIKDGDTTTSKKDALVFFIPLGSTADYKYDVFNIPYQTAKIVKKDAGNYPEDVLPWMQFNVYEVPAGTTEPQTAAEVAALIAAEGTVLVIENASTVQENAADKSTFYDWETWDPSKTYLLVENQVGRSAGDTYNTMNKDDNRVKWFKLISPNPSETTFVLYNVYGEADVELAKAVDKSSVESLLKSSCDVEYTVTPTFLKNANQPLSKFTLTDTGLTFNPTSTSGPQPSYKITEVNVGAASQSTAYMKYTFDSNTRVSAKVTFTYSDNTTEEVLIDDVSSGGVARPTKNKDATEEDPTEKFAVSFVIDYYSQGVMDATMEGTGENAAPVYVLGHDFTVAPTKVKVTVNRLKDGTSDDPVTEIEKFTNTAKVDLEYPKWNSEGTARTTVTDSDTKTAVTTVGTLDLPHVKIEKSSDPMATVIAGDPITYTLTATNNGPGNFVNPVLLDMLPTGVTFTSLESVTCSNSSKTFTYQIQQVPGEATQYIEDASGNLVLGDPERAVVFELTGTLAPGESVSVVFKAKIADTAILYGAKLDNFVFLSSTEPAYHIKGKNPNGYPFVNEDGTTFPGVLTEEVHKFNDSRLNTVATTREGGLDDALGQYADNGYVWAKAPNTVTIASKGGVNLNKAIWADRDASEGFKDSELSIASRNNSTPGVEFGDGWVKYRLTVANGSPSEKTWLVVGDLLPRINEDTQTRATYWDVVWDDIEAVMLNGTQPENKLTEGTDYWVFLYTGSGNANAALREAVLKSNDWLIGGENYPAWPNKPDSELNSLGWVRKTDQYSGDTTVKAFLIVFNSPLILQSSKNLIVTYNTKVQDMPNDDYFNEHYAFENTDNNFLFYYQGSVNDEGPVINRSNVVSATVMDRLFEIEGDLWIDEDQDGKQQTANRRDYSKYAIVTELAAATEFYIKDNRKAAQTWSEKEDDTGSTVTDIGWGESVKHFRFEELGPARLRDGLSESDLYDANYDLKLLSLKTTDPFNYILETRITNAGLLDIFKHTINVAEYYKSDNPDTLTASSPNVYDDNFLATDNKAYFDTKSFFLPYANKVDQTKDVGMQTFRGLEIKKVAADNTAVNIAGAEFQIYGPYGDSSIDERTEAQTTAPDDLLHFSLGTDGVYTLVNLINGVWYTAKEEIAVDSNTVTTTLVTDSDGKIKVEDLNWWKEYDIKEISTIQGYDIIGTTATGADGTLISEVVSTEDYAVFTLKVPATTRTSAQRVDQVTVKNPRTVEIPLQAIKMLETVSTEDYTFQYELRLTNVTPAATRELNKGLMPSVDPDTGNTIDKVIETIDITVSPSSTAGLSTGTGKFADVKVSGEGTYIFTIKEIAPNPIPAGWTYDQQLEKTATVVVKWDDKQKKLVVDSIEYSKPHTVDGETYVLFENKYEKSGEWTPNVSKQLTGRPIIPEEFTFTVKEGSTTVSTGTVNADGSVTFTPVTYTLEDVGIHTYTITEVEGSSAGVTYSEQSFTVSVKVEDDKTKDKLVVTPTYPSDTTFINTWNATGEWKPEVWKVLIGRDFNEGETFTTTVKDASGNTLMTGTVSVGRDGDPTAFTFDPVKINYTEADLVNFAPTTFTYTISEEVPAQNPSNGVTFSTEIYTVNVTIEPVPIKDNDGKIIGYSDKLKVTDDAPKKMEFINTYEFQPTTDKPKVTKKMSGETTVQALTFEFTLKATSMKDEDGADITDTSKLPVDATGTIVVGDPDNDSRIKTIEIPRGASTKFEKLFDEITYKIPGTYVYEIRETVEANNNNIIFDQTVWTYTVVVTDNLQGSLVAVGSYEDADGDTSDAADFINEYVPTPTEIPLWVEKVLTGEPLHDAENTWFEFTVEFEKATVIGGYELPAVTPPDEKPTVRIQGTDVEAGGEAARAHFDNIKFTKEGTYDFLIREKVGTLPRVYYDTTVWRATVTVVDYPPQGTYPGGLEATVVYTNLKTSTPWSWAKFSNNYTPEDVTYTPEVHKILTGEPRPKDPNDLLTFYFKLEVVSQIDTKGKPITENGVTIPTGGDSTFVVDNGGSDPIVSHFGQLTFHKKGTYTFKITELPGTNGHYVYDRHEWTLVVVVKDDDQGNLILDPAQPVYTRDDDTKNDYAEFKNQYTPDPVEWHPSAKKLMDKTGEPTVKEKEFTFNLTADSGNPAGAEIIGDATITVKVPAGSWESPIVDFGNIKFTKEGTFKFHVKEADNGLPGVIAYDGTDTVLTVEITNIHDQLTVTDVSATGNVDIDGVVTTVKFTNKYVPTPTDWQAQVRKLMKAGEPTMSEKTFTFTLEATKFVAKGAFQGNNEITSSNKTWTRTITVPKGATLYDVVSDPKTFDLITFKKAGSYEFTISEKSGSEAGITYTGDVVTVKIEVIDRDGYLVKQISTSVEEKGAIEEKTIVKVFKIVKENEDSDPVEVEVKPGDENADLVTVSVDFNNRYDVKPVPYTPPVTKNIKVDFGDTVAEKIFRFDLKLISAKNDVDVNGQTVPRVLYDASDPDNIIDILDNDFVRTDSATVIVEKGGTVKSTSFSEIIFRKAGTYVFEITEYEPGEDETDPPLEEGITYSKKVWTMTVKVKDTNEGTPSKLALDGKVQYVEKVNTSKLTDAEKKEFIPEPIATNRIEAILESLKDEAVLEVEKEAVEDEKVKADADATEESEELEGPVFENEYKPEPVKWIPMIQKLLSDDSNVVHVDRTFDFEFKRVTAASGGTNDPSDAKEAADNKEAVSEAVEEIPAAKEAPADAKATSDGCDLSTDKTLYARATLKKDDATKKSVPEYFYPNKDANGVPTGEPVTITFDKAGTYYFEVKEILPDPTDSEAIKKLYPGFTYDTDTKTVEVKVTDIDGDLIIEKVTVAGAVVYEVKITEVTDTNTGRITYKVEDVETLEKPEGYSDDTTIDEVTGKKIVITTVKITNEYHLGRIAIYKLLENHEDVNEELQNGTERVQDPTTFVFSVEAEWSYPGYSGSVKVYSNVISKVFTEAGEQLVAVIEDLPEGSVVTVKEIYAGGNYDLISSKETVTVTRTTPLTPVEQLERANFDNAHNGKWKDGGSVTNIIDSEGDNYTAIYADGRTSTVGGGPAEAEPEPEPQEAK